MKAIALPIGLVLVAAVLLWQLSASGPDSPVVAVSPREDLGAEINELPSEPASPSSSSGAVSPIAEAGQRAALGVEVVNEDSQRSLRGTVLALETQEPISGVTLKATLVLGGSTKQLASTRTGPDGRYELDLVQHLPTIPEVSIRFARVRVTAVVEGYQPSTSGHPLEALLERSHDLDFLLERGPTLRGRILKPTGEPAVHARTQLVTILREFTTEMRSSQVDGDAEFTISWGAEHPSYFTAGLDGYAGIYLDLRDRDLFDYTDLGDLYLGWGASIRGRVTCEDGTPMPGIEVKAQASSPRISTKVTSFFQAWKATTDGAGYFEVVGLEGEEFTLTLGDDQFGPVKPGGLEFDLVPSQPILIVVVEDEHGQPLRGIDLEATFRAREGGKVWITDFDSEMSGPSDGKALFRTGPCTEVLLSVELSEGHIYREILELASGACYQELRFIVPPKPPLGLLTVELTGPEGEPVRDVVVELYSSLDNMSLRDLEGDGPYEVVVGSYHGEVFTSDHQYEDCVPIAISGIEIAANEELRLERKLQLGGRIEVEIILLGAESGAHQTDDADSTHATVVAHDSTGRVFDLNFIVGSNARSNVPLLGEPCRADSVLAPGLYTFVFEVMGHEAVEVQATITAGETTPLRVEVSREAQ